MGVLEAIAEAERQTNFSRDILAKGKQGSATERLFSAYTGGMNVYSNLTRQTNTSHHAEQYKHFTGRVYSSIRPIALRIARQPLRVAIKTKVKTADYLAAIPKVKNQKDKQELVHAAKVRGWQDTENKRKLPGWLKTYAENIDIIEEHPFID